jgi:hypothetical protein
MSCGDFDVVTGESFTALLRKRPVVIALYAPTSQSGKTEAAKALNEIGFETVKFAGPLKEMTRAFLRSINIDAGSIERMVEGNLKEFTIPGLDPSVTTRRIMQTIGTECRDQLDRNLWVNLLLQRCRSLVERGVSVVVDDMRFPFEKAALEGIGAKTVRILRPGYVPVAGDPYEGQLEAETFDCTITNDGTRDELRTRILGFVRTP